MIYSKNSSTMNSKCHSLDQPLIEQIVFVRNFRPESLKRRHTSGCYSSIHSEAPQQRPHARVVVGRNISLKSGAGRVNHLLLLRNCQRTRWNNQRRNDWRIDECIVEPAATEDGNVTAHVGSTARSELGYKRRVP